MCVRVSVRACTYRRLGPEGKVIILSWLCGPSQQEVQSRFGDFLGEHAPKLTLTQTRACVCKDLVRRALQDEWVAGRLIMTFFCLSRNSVSHRFHLCNTCCDRAARDCLHPRLRWGGREVRARTHLPSHSFPPSLPPSHLCSSILFKGGFDRRALTQLVNV